MRKAIWHARYLLSVLLVLTTIWGVRQAFAATTPTIVVTWGPGTIASTSGCREPQQNVKTAAMLGIKNCEDFVYKFLAKSFPGCSGGNAGQLCLGKCGGVGCVTQWGLQKLDSNGEIEECYTPFGNAIPDSWCSGGTQTQIGVNEDGTARYAPFGLAGGIRVRCGECAGCDCDGSCDFQEECWTDGAEFDGVTARNEVTSWASPVCDNLPQ